MTFVWKVVDDVSLDCLVGRNVAGKGASIRINVRVRGGKKETVVTGRRNCARGRANDTLSAGFQ